MAYNSQPSYGTAPNMSYRHQQNQYGTSERPRTAGSERNPHYQHSGRAQTPLGGFRHGSNSNEVFSRRDGRGNGGWSEDRLGGEEGVMPTYPQTFVETRRDPNSSHHAVGAARPDHAPPASQFKAPQFDRYQYQEPVHLSSTQDVRQPPQYPHQELPRRPNYEYEPTNTDTSKNNMRDNRINPRVQPKIGPSVTSESIINYQREQAMPSQQQDYAASYRQESFHGNEGPTSGGSGTEFSRARVGDVRGQIQYSGPQQTWGKTPTRQRILARAPSPEIISWDNPFPAFGAKKKSTGGNDRADLNHSMSRMKLGTDSHSDPNGGQRPQTASSKSSQASSRVGQRRIDESDVLQAASPISQNPSDRQFRTAETAPPTVGLGQRTPIESFIPRDRHSEDTRIRPSFNSNTSSDFDTQRSRTMPNDISRVARNFSSPREYDNKHLGQEPGPSARYYGQESVGHLETKPANKFLHGVADQSHFHPGDSGKTGGNGELTLSSTSSHPRHSTHNSLGEVYDSYFHEPGRDQQIHSQNQTRQRAESFDEDMPNFDAVPAARLGHRRGTTIDEHLQLQANTFDSPQPLAEAQRDRPEALRQDVHTAGQFNRSKSQPNLKDQLSRDGQFHNGFVFDLPESAPPLPLVSPRRDTFARQNISPAGYSGNDGYMTGQGAPTAARSDGRAISNDPHQKAFQGGPYSESYRSPPSQNEFASQGIRTAPARESTPGNAILPISPSQRPSKSAEALALHPAPFRPGLMQDTLPFQSIKPRSTGRNDFSPSAIQHQESSPIRATSVPSKVDRQSTPVTYDELERLRQAVKSKPSDQNTQLLLAKKLVEASMVLADGGGRVDPKTKNKNREKYILEAHKIVKKLVSGHSAEATFYLADCYSTGLLGLEVDPKEAFILYQTAAKAGHAQSAYRVAVCYEMGQEDGGGTRRDPNKAFHWYQRAATLGDTPAMYKLGVIQLKGLLGQQKNPKEALNWLKRAAEQANEENPHALHELGLLYEGAGPKSLVDEDLEYSKQLFTQAANLGYKFSQFRLGCAYEYGLRGCPVDPRQSIAWYSKAAMQEEHQSELALSGWYLTGSEGVLLQSDTEAYLWARKAAQAGLAKAEYAMGYFTEVGIGVPANLEDAKRWYWRSASQNFPKARDRLEALRKGGAKMEKSRVSRSAIRKQSEGECTIM